MKRPVSRFVAAAAFLSLAAAGCAGTARPPAGTAGFAHLEEIQRAIEAAAMAVKPSLVYVEATLQMPGGGGPPGRRPGGGPGGPGGGMPGMGSQTVGMTGIIVDTDLVLLPIPLPENAERIQVWHNGNAVDASVARVDPRVQFTVVRAALGAPTAPLSPLPVRAARTGEWVSVVAAFGKEAEFQKMTDLGIIRGRVKGEVDTLVVGAGLAGSLGQQIGAVVLGLDGQILGIYKVMGGRPALVSFADCRERVEKLAARADKPGDPARSGREKRQPWFGANLVPLNEKLAEAKGLPKESLVARAVFAGSPAAQAGLAAGDLVVGVDGKTFSETGAQLSSAFMKALAPEIGRSVTLRVLRGGQTLEKPIVLGEVPELRTLKVDSLGIGVSEITEEIFHDMRRQISGREGVIVNEIVRGSPAAVSEQFGRSLLMPNDVITELHGSPVRNFDDFSRAVEAVRRESPDIVLVKATRGIFNIHAALNLSLGREAGKEGE